ncbi:unnamed protein product [Phytophthora fragariaefolia]|uniref:Unnamed protein product n=1 Tax=Phytophthora fragariaefolia TaxID=1490495 RepID=A0A9W6XMP4_9STRA|nr:unnamed protein product [Phytophthora fragariaefolia]
MRVRLLVSVVTIFVAFANGLDNNVLVTNRAKTTASGGNPVRNLKGNKIAEMDTNSEERVSGANRLVSFFKRKAARLNFLKKNPSIATTLDNNPAVAKQVETLYNQPGLVNSIKKSDNLSNLRNAVAQHSGQFTEAKLERIGSAAKKATTSTRGIDDEEGMLLAYGVLFVMIVIILGVGYHKATN